MKPVPSAGPPYPEPRSITTNFLPSSGRRGLLLPSSGRRGLSSGRLGAGGRRVLAPTPPTALS